MTSMINTTRTRKQESNGFRLTAKRQEALEKAKTLGLHFNTDIFKNPLTRTMGVDELIQFSQNSTTQVTNNPTSNVVSIATHQHVIQEQVESINDIETKVTERFKIMEEIVLSTAMGINKSLILSGSAGVGKSTTVMNVIESLDIEYALVKGDVTKFGLFSLLYQNRHENSLLVFDDSDSIFNDESRINLLKAATDSSDKRIISYHTSKDLFDEDGNEIDSDFEFNGKIIFISNIDMYRESNSNSKLAPHFEALISRSFVLDVTMKNEKWYMARIKDVLYNHMDNKQYDDTRKDEIYQFMDNNKFKLRELSLRVVKKISMLIDTYNTGWQEKALVLLCK